MTTLQERIERKNISDPIEIAVADFLDALKISWVHESQNKAQELDFYLPDFDCFIECKAMSTDRTARQIAGKEVIVVQGYKTLAVLKAILALQERLKCVQKIIDDEVANDKVKVARVNAAIQGE